MAQTPFQANILQAKLLICRQHFANEALPSTVRLHIYFLMALNYAAKAAERSLIVDNLSERSAVNWETCLAS